MFKLYSRPQIAAENTLGVGWCVGAALERIAGIGRPILIMDINRGFLVTRFHDS